MKQEILRDGPVEPNEIADLRQAVGWDRSEGTYEKTLPRHYAHYTARGTDNRLVGYMSVLSDGVSDAFLLDLAVHPHCRKNGLGARIVRRAIRDLKEAGVRCVQVTFTDDLEPFYAQCGFHMIKGGIIDFKNMTWDEESQPPPGN
jgi:N-acetylglutamate synthase-like GNAT family acetyltransferase